MNKMTDNFILVTSIRVLKNKFLGNHRSDPEIAPGYTHCEKYRHGFFIGGFKRCGGWSLQWSFMAMLL